LEAVSQPFIIDFDEIRYTDQLQPYIDEFRYTDVQSSAQLEIKNAEPTVQKQQIIKAKTAKPF
jgi:hypothetical protein